MLKKIYTIFKYENILKIEKKRKKKKGIILERPLVDGLIDWISRFDPIFKTL